MGFAEKKAELLRIAETADEETTGKLIDFYHQLLPNAELDEATALYEKRIDDFITSGEKGISGNEMVARLKKMLQ